MTKGYSNGYSKGYSKGNPFQRLFPRGAQRRTRANPTVQSVVRNGDTRIRTETRQSRLAAEAVGRAGHPQDTAPTNKPKVCISCGFIGVRAPSNPRLAKNKAFSWFFGSQKRKSKISQKPLVFDLFLTFRGAGWGGAGPWVPPDGPGRPQGTVGGPRRP